MKFSDIIKSPQLLISALAAGIAVLGTAGIITGVQGSALQALLTAVLGVVTAFGHATAAKTLEARAAAKAARAARSANRGNPDQISGF